MAPDENDIDHEDFQVMKAKSIQVDANFEDEKVQKVFTKKVLDRVKKIFEEILHGKEAEALLKRTDAEILALLNLLFGTEEIHIEWTDRLQQPVNDDPSWLQENTTVLANIHSLADGLKDYADLPIITDELKTDHKERKRRRDAMHVLFGPLFVNFLDRSKLRKSQFFGFQPLMEGIVRALRRHESASQPDESTTAKIEMLKTHLESLTSVFSLHEKPVFGNNPETSIDNYEQLSYEEKLEFARTVNPKIKEFLQELQRILTLP